MKKETWKKAGMALFLVGLALLVWVGPPSRSTGGTGALQPEAQSLYPTTPWGWLTYYMHEVYERYTQAKIAFEKKDMKMADANLVVMEIFTNLSKTNLPDRFPDGRPFDKAAYKKSIDQLNVFSAQIRANLKKSVWANVPAGKPDPVMATCYACHTANNVPTDWKIDSQLKVLTHAMHEIYELYRQAGPLLQQQQWDPAMACFLVLRPYIEQIPLNIPTVNQDGQKIDKALFLNAYKDLKQFTEEIIKKLETHSWDSGKPLPPPRIVVDNCYACHAKVVKIPPPW